MIMIIILRKSLITSIDDPFEPSLTSHCDNRQWLLNFLVDNI